MLWLQLQKINMQKIVTCYTISSLDEKILSFIQILTV